MTTEHNQEAVYVNPQEAGIHVRETPLTSSERKLEEMLDEAGFYEQGADGCAILRDICIELLDKLNTAPAVPEIDYQALIRAAYATNNKWAQGTNGCSAFARGAEWFRAQMLAATPATPSQPVTLTEAEIISVKKASKASDPTKPWGDSIAFAEAIIAALREKEGE